VIGSGDGEAVLLLAREFPAARIRGLDTSPERVREATARVGLDPEGRVAFKAGRGRALPYPEAFFDLIVHRVGRPASGEIARVMQPGGHLVLVPADDPGLGGRLGQRALLARLARRGFAWSPPERAGGGKFYVARFGEQGPAGPSI